jgi:hypothetical protein
MTSATDMVPEVEHLNGIIAAIAAIGTEMYSARRLSEQTARAKLRLTSANHCLSSWLILCSDLPEMPAWSMLSARQEANMIRVLALAVSCIKACRCARHRHPSNACHHQICTQLRPARRADPA